MLRGAPPEVRLLICRPGPGILYEVDDNTLVSVHTPEHMYCKYNLIYTQVNNRPSV